MKVGLILIGDELLSGLRQDKHVNHVRQLLNQRGLALSWIRIIGDDWDLLTTTLRETLRSDDIVFSFGGIGATPDDLTRQAAAAASGLELTRHPQAVALIEQRFGAEAYPNRIRMAELPDGASLLPNPVNQIPGFRLQHHHFVPGFPDMAWPMIEWALDEYYRDQFDTTPMLERRWILREVKESELIPMMELLLQTFPAVRLSSLPSTRERNQIDFGLKGRAEALQPACDWLEQQLITQKILYTPAPPGHNQT
jgi:molybdopterin-biosynthesis enzyme MoeA-like protein